MTTIYKKLKLEELEHDKSYTFYETNGTTFQATFDNILQNTLIVKDYKKDNHYGRNNTIVLLPKERVSYVESTEFKIKINNFM